MASINMSGRQSFVLNDFKEEIRRGGDVTHILNVKVSRKRENATSNHIRTAIYGVIANKPVTKEVMGERVTNTWKKTHTITSTASPPEDQDELAIEEEYA